MVTFPGSAVVGGCCATLVGRLVEVVVDTGVEPKGHSPWRHNTKQTTVTITRRTATNPRTLAFISDCLGAVCALARTAEDGVEGALPAGSAFADAGAPGCAFSASRSAFFSTGCVFAGLGGASDTAA